MPRTNTGSTRHLSLPDDALPETSRPQADPNATFGAVLRLERGHATQQQLAAAAGLDRRSIDRLENGQRLAVQGVNLADRAGAAAG